jgi:LETM1 and EF-hand domain-containing protein 1
LAASAEPSSAETATPAVTEAPEVEDARMTKEQLGELAEALHILTAKSSIVKERDELKELLQENLLSEAVSAISCRTQTLADLSGIQAT